MEATARECFSITLLELLSNTLVLDVTLSYLPLPTIFRLSSISKSFKRLIYETPRVFHYLDLSRCRGAYVAPSVLPIDSGSHSWRAERMDENLTEDEFYSGPLRGISTKLSKIGVMMDVQTLVLDGLGSVTHDVLSDILLSDQYNVRLLSVVDCPNLNKSKFQELLRYLCRTSRPEGAPRLKGVYVFGTNDSLVKQTPRRLPTTIDTGITAIQGAQIGGPCSLSLCSTDPSPPNSNPWFSPTGAVLPHSFVHTRAWEDTLRICSGLIAFDAVLCTHMHEEMAPFRSDAMNSYLTRNTKCPPIATYALGSKGCAGCESAPEGAPVWGESELTAFPLVSPPPFSGRLIDAVRPPPPTSEGGGKATQRLVVSCTWCLSDRHCQSCHRYWCGNCYDPQRRKRALELEAQAEQRDDHVLDGSISEELRRVSDGGGSSIKVYNGLCTQFCAFSEDLAAGNGGMWG